MLCLEKEHCSLNDHPCASLTSLIAPYGFFGCCFFLMSLNEWAKAHLSGDGRLGTICGVGAGKLQLINDSLTHIWTSPTPDPEPSQRMQMMLIKDVEPKYTTDIGAWVQSQHLNHPSLQSLSPTVNLTRWVSRQKEEGILGEYDSMGWSPAHTSATKGELHQVRMQLSEEMEDFIPQSLLSTGLLYLCRSHPAARLLRLHWSL